MAHNFRTAFNGFNKEDVVRYLEYINAKHQSKVNQLNTQINELQARLEEPVHPSQDFGLAERCRILEEENQTLLAQKQALEARCAELSANPEPAGTVRQDSRELEAYRQAERIQKEARDRTELLYFQANHILEETTSRVEGAAADMTVLTDQVMQQITRLQVAASSSKQALQEASSILATIRPNR